MIHTETDTALHQINKQTFRVIRPAQYYLLKKISIKKKPLHYSFIGGMWYTTAGFSFHQDILLPFPFTSYYTYKIPDITKDGLTCRSLIYVKTPLMILQFKNECISILFDPKIRFKNEDIFPFIALDEDEKNYYISFYLFPEYSCKEKEHAWLGFGKKQTIRHNIQKQDTFLYSIEIKQGKQWTDSVKETLSSFTTQQYQIKNTDELFNNAKQALYRSYDHITGTFLQLPWRKTPGFTFVNSSYSLTSYDAIRLHYFSKWYTQTNDDDYAIWQKKLRELFTQSALRFSPKTGKGIIWANMTNLTKNGLQGFFYLDCGYAGYPGGQATITYHLLKYLTYNPDKEIEKLVKQSLDYILSTQQDNGSWPMAIKQVKQMSIRRETLSDYTTSGGTGECIRALLEAYKQYNNKQYKDAAQQALNYLDTHYPICRNGLRDIGIQEPEAFSAISIIDAYLDAYELFDQDIYLERAQTYALYCACWFYWHTIYNMEFTGNFHPISYSITPRLSPFEATRIVTTFRRLGRYTKDALWNTLADRSFSEVTKWITVNGGLSEGVFPVKNQLKRLPMEQTFATVEFMKSCLQYTTLKKTKKQKKQKKKPKGYVFEKENNILYITNKNKKLFYFDVEQWKIGVSNKKRSHPTEITCSFYNSYAKKHTIPRTIKKHLRGSIGKYLLGISDVNYFIKGVYGPKPLKDIAISSFEHIKKTHVSIHIHDTSVECICKTSLHRLSTTITLLKKGDDIIIKFSPINIEVLVHDIDCKQVLYPVIHSKMIEKNDNILTFDGFKMKGRFPQILSNDRMTAIDQTLKANWTHGGIFHDSFELIIPQNNLQ